MIKTSVFTLLLLTGLLGLSACSTSPDKPEENKDPQSEAYDLNFTKNIQVVSGNDYCYPIETDDSFDHPIDVLPVTVTEHTTIWPSIQAELAFASINHPKIRKRVEWYKSNPTYIKKVQQRSARYIYAIWAELQAEGLPADLALLPIVESTYEPFSYSHGQASGLWQFIPITAKRFRLESNWWKDDRRNTLKATRAAIKYLSYLYRYFDNDWLLAIAAYNAGEGNVRKAINYNKKRGKPTDFWHLKLPKETMAYVPKLVALSHVFKRPEHYGLSLLPIPNEPYFETIALDSQLDLAQAATLMDTPIDELYYLNPDLNQWATPPQKTYSFHVPAGKKASFEAALAKLPKTERINWHRHKILRGDTISRLAQTYNSNVKLIREINNLESKPIIAGKYLLIPTAKNEALSYTYSRSQRLRSLHNSRSLSQNTKISHKVKAGESLWLIARKYKVSVNQIARWNNMAPKDPLRVNDTLVIWQKKKQPARKGMVKKVHYKVRSGDSLARISSKFNVSIKDIVKWNNINPDKYLRKGQSLKLYVDMSKNRY